MKQEYVCRTGSAYGTHYRPERRGQIQKCVHVVEKKCVHLRMIFAVARLANGMGWPTRAL